MRKYSASLLLLIAVVLAALVLQGSSSSGSAWADDGSHSVTFESNSGVGSLADQSAGVSTALTSNTFTRSGFTFAGWNTAADGSGTAFSDGASYSFSTNITLFAQWSWIPSYYPSGPQTNVTTTSVTGGGWELCWSGPYNGFAKFSVILAACDGEYIMYTGWSGVSTSPETLPSTLPVLAAAPRSDVFATTATASIADATSSNGSKWYFGDDRGAAADGSQAVGFTDTQSGTPCYDGSLSICWHSAPNIPASYGWGGASPAWAATEAGLSPGWSLAATRLLGQGPSDGNGANYTRAIFHVSNPNQSVTFNANSGSGSMSSQSGSSATALTSNTFTRTGFTFAGWNTAANGSGTPYSDGESFDFSVDLTLYAQWTAVVAAPVSSGGGSESGSVAVQSDPAPARAVVVVPRRAQAAPAVTSPAVIARTQQSSGSSQPAEAVALVGGKEVVVKAAGQGSQAASYGVGKVTVDVGVAVGDGVVDSVGGVPSLKIANNAPASLKGSGLQPNSTMQVFLPASDGSFIELPSVAVAADGSFDSSLTFGTSNRAKPMPIGERFIQMVGIDEDGNETVLDIPVTISQPVPAPEINRVNGQRPLLTPGQTSAFNAGAPETVTLKRSGAATSVEGDGWAFTVGGSTTGQTAPTLGFTRDAPVTFSGEGFMPGTRADVWLFSDPTLLGTVDIAADGTFSANFAVDSNFVPTGDHTLQIQGVGDDGFVRAANLGVVVQDTTNTPVVPLVGDPFNWVPMILVGTSIGGLLILVGVTLAIRRRQRPSGRLAPVS